jgi:transcriptional regulator GlxA family with amidase domain
MAIGDKVWSTFYIFALFFMLLNMNSTKHIVIVAPPLTSLLDVTGPLEVFAKATDLISLIGKDTQSYTLHVVSTQEAKVLNTSTVPIVCEGNLRSINYDVDTLLVTGIPNAPDNMVDKSSLQWLRDHVSSIRRFGSVCGGAFILAEAGILDGRRATTHWRVCEKLARLYPTIKVETDPIFVKDGHIYTSAGISAGMDLALALVEEDHGREIALMVARQLVLYLKRPGNQSQYSAMLTLQNVDYQPIHELQAWVMEHLSETLSVEMMAERVSMSPRNFARVFLRETGITPAKFIEKLRLETARRRLEETNLTLEEISGECGLGGPDTMRRLFVRHLRTTPSDYRRGFQTALS